VAPHRRRREQLYNQYAANLKLAKTVVSLEPDIDDTILCPLCFRLFDRAALEVPQALTLDHVPPQALGGQDSQAVLVCGNCNHNLGTKLDARAKVHLATKDFIENVPGSSVEGHFAFGSLPKAVAEFRYDDIGSLRISRDSKRVNPVIGKQEQDYLQSLVGQLNVNTTAQMQFADADPQLVSVAWLRYAYLIFFRWFGYMGIFHENFTRVREQILNPSENLLSMAWESFTAEFATTLSPGVHAIQRPVNFQSFVVVFDVSTQLRTIRKVVILPRLNQPGLAIYDRLISLRNIPQRIDIKGTQVPQFPEYWTDLQACRSECVNNSETQKTIN
jgi:hypothetical protein